MERTKMPRINRAAQFAPFDALKGLHDALREKEKENEKIVKEELTDEQIKELSNAVLSLRNGDLVCVKFYSCGNLLTLHGKVKVNLAQRFLIVNSRRIVFDDLISIEKIKEQKD